MTISAFAIRYQSQAETIATRSKKKESEVISKQIDDFLKAGGEIQKVSIRKSKSMTTCFQDREKKSSEF